MSSNELSSSTAIVKVQKERPYGGAGGINPRHANLTPEQRCKAHKKNGDQCKLPPILGAQVCRAHGGAARHVKAAARARLENAADRMAEQLLGIAVDDRAPLAVRLAAIKDALDRAGLSPRQALDVTHELKPYERLLARVQRGPRPRAVVDGEVVSPSPAAQDPACRACGLDFSDWPEPPGGYPAMCKACRRDVEERTQDREPGPAPSPQERARPPREPHESPTGGEYGLVSGEEAVALAAAGQPRARRKRRG